MTDSPTTPLRASWSSLQCLSSLSWTPPSPIGSPSALMQRPSSGEIPIIFDLGISTPVSPTGHHSRQRRPSRPLTEIYEEYDDSAATFDCNTPLNGSWSATGRLRLFGSNASVNTFGMHYSTPNISLTNDSSPSLDPAHDNPNLPTRSSYLHNIPHVPALFSTPPTQYATSLKYSTPSPPMSRTPIGSALSQTRSNDSSATSIRRSTSKLPDIVPAYAQASAVVDDVHLGCSASEMTISSYVTACTEPPPPPHDTTDELSFLALEDTVSTEHCGWIEPSQRPELELQRTPSATTTISAYTDNSMIFAEISPGMPYTTRAFPEPPQSRTRKIARASALKRKALVPRNENLGVPLDGHISQWTSPIIFNRAGDHGSTLSSANSVSSDDLSRGSCPSHDALTSSGDTGYFLDLPTHLTWLSSINIELMIDQENFRDIRPCLRLAGMASETGGQVMAEFKPVDQLPYHFHHSSFDPDPVLRRLVIDGDEDHDALSRLASLTLKGEGTYMVTGCETLRPPSKPSHGTSFHPFAADGKASWRFVYNVANRLSSTGQIMPGEKTLTPLSFSCAPRLLHADVGHRVSLLQVARKLTRSKLFAKLVHPAKPPAPELSSKMATRRPFARTKENFPPSAWYVHSRQNSATSSNSTDDDTLRLIHKENTAQQRLASTSSSKLGTEVLDHPFSSGYALTDHHAALAPPIPLSDRHILPHAELSSLITSFQTTSDMLGLSPPPVASRSLTLRLSPRAIN